MAHTLTHCRPVLSPALENPRQSPEPTADVARPEGLTLRRTRPMIVGDMIQGGVGGLEEVVKSSGAGQGGMRSRGGRTSCSD